VKNAKNRRNFFFHRLEEPFCLEYGSAFDFIAFTGALSGGRPLPPGRFHLLKFYQNFVFGKISLFSLPGRDCFFMKCLQFHPILNEICCF
jgi:hypothetical protein